MKKILLLITTVLFILSCSKTKDSESTTTPQEKIYKIGITQIVTHPSLDQTKEGFKKAIEEAGLKAEFDEKNAEGTIANANLIANNFKADKKDLVFGIATPSAQALANTITDIPVLFSAVTDPAEANILNANVTGTSDKLDNVGEQIDLLLTLKPEVKTIGILYNTSEANSIVQVKDIEAKAKERGIKVELVGLTASSELPQATKTLLSRSDALYLPTDNLVISGVKLVNSEALLAGKPVVASEDSSVALGSLFTMGLNYFDLGKRTGEMAVEILKNGKKPSDIHFETVKSTTLSINEDTAKKLGIDLNNPVLKDAKLLKTE